MMYMYVVCVGSCFYKVSLNYGVDGGGGGGENKSMFYQLFLSVAKDFKWRDDLKS